jgi:hypothetical protein
VHRAPDISIGNIATYAVDSDAVPALAHEDNLVSVISCSLSPMPVYEFPMTTAVLTTEIADKISDFEDGTMDQEYHPLPLFYWITLMFYQSYLLLMIFLENFPTTSFSKKIKHTLA